MFGYIKPFVPDLRVREHELYRAIYCGLCRSMGRHTGCSSRLTLSYDFAFLCAVRMALEKTTPKINIARCAASPLKTRPVMEDNPVLAYCASCAAVLTLAKVKDDINDSAGADMIKPRLLMPLANGMAKKASKQGFDLPSAEIEDGLHRLSLLEEECCPSLDTVADCFGQVLSAVFSCGLEGMEKSIAKAFGFSVGKIIYVLDAADDVQSDKKKNNYNPLNIEPVSHEALSMAVRFELSRAEAAANLIDRDCMPELRELIFNVIYEGIPKEADRVFKKQGKDCPKKGE